MKTFYNQSYYNSDNMDIHFSVPTLREDLEKTRIALEIAYAGFDNAVDPDMVDCYIYEINALLKRYKHLAALSAEEYASAAEETVPTGRLRGLYEHSPIHTLVSHVLG